MRLAVIVVIAITFLSTGVFVAKKKFSKGPDVQEQVAAIYSCPMHPQVISDKPGSCPICHMDLTKVETHVGHEQKVDGTTTDNSQTMSGMKSQTAPTDKKAIYSCPMHPQVISDKPGTCPICHMDLALVEDDHAHDSDAAVDDGEARSTSIDDRAGFKLGMERQQLIGVTFHKIHKGSLIKEIRATGKVAYDPELYTAIEEYRQAILSYNQVKDSKFEPLKVQTKALVDSAKTKLKIMGLSDEKIKELGLNDAHKMGLILPKGMVWIYTEIFENELVGVKIGQKIIARSSSLPGKNFVGKISSISPLLNTPTRSIRVQADVPDKEGLLRPDTYLDVSIQIDLGEKLFVPESAVLFSQGDAFTFVSHDRAHFEPKLIKVGQKAGDKYELIGGIDEGDEIVKSANFLIDSESKLRAVVEKARVESKKVK